VINIPGILNLRIAHQVEFAVIQEHEYAQELEPSHEHLGLNRRHAQAGKYAGIQE